MLNVADDAVIRMAVVGTHGVGKSELSAPLAEVLQTNYIPEQARAVARALGLKPGAVPLNRFCEYQTRAMEAHHASECMFDAEGFVSDRGVSCYAGYGYNAPDGIIRHHHADYGIMLSAYSQMLQIRLPRYTHIVFVPKMFELENDGERHVDAAFQDLIEQYYEATLLPLIQSTNPDVKILRIQTDGVVNRVNEVVEWLKQPTTDGATREQ